MVQLSHPYMTSGKTIALTIQTFVGKVMSLLFNMLSRFVIAFLPRSKRLSISWLPSLSTVILEAKKKIESVTVSIFSPVYLPWSDRTKCHDISFVNVEGFFFLIEFVTVLFMFYGLVFWGMRDLSSLTRDRTHTSCIGRRSLNYQAAREFLVEF